MKCLSTEVSDILKIKKIFLTRGSDLKIKNNS